MKPTDAQVRLLKDLFINRTDVFAYQWWNATRKEGGYVKAMHGECANDPPCGKRNCEHKSYTTLEPKHVITHLKGKETLGIYQLGADDTVKWLCLDVDIDKGARMAEGVDPRESVQAHTRTLARVLSRLNFPFLVEDSGSRGYHLWVFFTDPIPANQAMSLGRWLEAQAEPPEGIHVEVFPKQASVRTLGSLVKLPLGVHRKTQRRCLFVGSNFEPYEDQWGALAEVKRLTPQAVDEIIATAGITLSPVRSASEAEEAQVGELTPPCFVTIMRDGVPQGSRDVAAFKLACYLRDRGLPFEMAERALEEWNERNDPPSEPAELATRIESAYRDSYSFFPCQEHTLDPFCDPSCRFYARKMRKRKRYTTR